MTTSPPRTDREGAYVHANGIDIHYVDQGEGEPLVLLHGGLVSTGPIWAGAPGAYVSHMDALAEHFRVIAPDARSAGATAHNEGTVSTSVLADDVLGLIDALGLNRPMLCGFSEGGLTATIVGLRHPDSVRAIVNHAGFDVLDPQSPVFMMGRVLLGGSPDPPEADPDAAAEAFAQHGMGELFDKMRTDIDSAQGDGSWRTYLRLTFDRWTRSPGYTFDDLRAMTTPTLVLTGDRDSFCSVEDAVTTYRSLPNAELAVLPDHDHSISATAVATSIDFLRRHTDR